MASIQLQVAQTVHELELCEMSRGVALHFCKFFNLNHKLKTHQTEGLQSNENNAKLEMYGKHMGSSKN